MGEHASIANFVYNKYVVPAFLRGDEQVTVRVHEVWRGLEGAYGLVAIHYVLCSTKFRESISLSPEKGQVFEKISETPLPSEYAFDLRPLRSRTLIPPPSPD